jgi:hypothetical protein
MVALTGSESFPSWRGAAGFAAAALRAINWRWVLATQAVAGLLALTSWLTSGSDAMPALLFHLLCAQALSALLVLLAAPAADEAVRRGYSVLRAFVVATLGVSVVNAAAQWILHLAFKDIGDTQRSVVVINDFFSVTGIWGIVLLVYLNRQSAARLLARLREDDLARVEAERLAISSRLKAIEAHVDSAEVLRRLSEIRYLYASGQDGADNCLENLITTLQNNVARAAIAGNGNRGFGGIRP